MPVTPVIPMPQLCIIFNVPLPRAFAMNTLVLVETIDAEPKLDVYFRVQVRSSLLIKRGFPAKLTVLVIKGKLLYYCELPVRQDNTLAIVHYTSAAFLARASKSAT